MSKEIRIEVDDNQVTFFVEDERWILTAPEGVLVPSDIVSGIYLAIKARVFWERLSDLDFVVINEKTHSILKGFSIPVVKRAFPTLLANEIVGVQPMTALQGLAYSLEFGMKQEDEDGQQNGN